MQAWYNAGMEQPNRTRSAALAQLKKAQLIIREGRSELAAANEKIRLAQELIDESAAALRDTPSAEPTGT